MEFKSRRAAAAVFLLFFVLLITPTPCLMRGLPNDHQEAEVYQIDYRGPETHSYLPPPNQSEEGATLRYHNLRHKSKDLMSGRRGKGTHG